MTDCDKSLCLQIVPFLLFKNVIKRLLIVKSSVSGPFLQLNAMYHCLRLSFNHSSTICKLIIVPRMVKSLHGLIKSSISPSRKKLWVRNFTGRRLNNCFIQIFKK